MRPTCRKAFTLIELLVVVVIIALMVGLLLPGVQASRAATRSVFCRSNLRQWAFAMQNHADAHGGDLPRRGQGMQPTVKFDRAEDWFNALPPFAESTPLVVQLTEGPINLNGIWRCPDFVEPADLRPFAYGMNMWLSTYESPTPDNLAKVGPLSTMVFMADGPGEYSAVLPAAKPFSPTPRHSGMANLAFLDGHVESYTGDEIGCEVGLVERPDVQWIVPSSPWPGPNRN